MSRCEQLTHFFDGHLAPAEVAAFRNALRRLVHSGVMPLD
jgi:hypothetical protein